MIGDEEVKEDKASKFSLFKKEKESLKWEHEQTRPI